MRVDEWRATIFLEHEGERLAFCSVRCRDRFQAEPARFQSGMEV